MTVILLSTSTRILCNEKKCNKICSEKVIIDSVRKYLALWLVM